MSLRAISTFAIDTTDTTQYPNVNVKAYLCTVNCNNVAISAIRKLIISAQEREQLSMDYTFIRDNHVVTINYCIVIKRHIQPYCCSRAFHKTYSRDAIQYAFCSKSTSP